MYLGIPESFMILAEMVSCCKQKARKFVLAEIPTQKDAVDDFSNGTQTLCFPLYIATFCCCFLVFQLENKIW